MSALATVKIASHVIEWTDAATVYQVSEATGVSMVNSN